MCEKVKLGLAHANRLIKVSHKRKKNKRGEIIKPNKKVPNRVYWCDECKAYHVTKYITAPKEYNLKNN